MGNAVERAGKAVLAGAVGALTIRGARRAGVVRRVAVVRQDARLGNAIAAVAVAEACKRAWPNAEVALVVAKPFGEIVAMGRGVSSVVEVDRKGVMRSPSALAKTWRELRALEPDVVFDCAHPHSFALDSFTFAVATRGRVRAGFDRRGRRRRYDVCVPYAPRMEDRYRPDVLADLVRAASGDDIRFARPRLDLPDECVKRAGRELDASARRPRVAVHLSAPPDRVWSADGFAEVSSRLLTSGVSVVVLSGPRDGVERARFRAALRGGAGSCTYVAMPSLARLAAVIAACGAFVSVDTGPLHVAVALGVPTVTLFVRDEAARVLPRDERHVWFQSSRAEFDPSAVLEAALALVGMRK